MEPKNCPSCGDAPQVHQLYAWHVSCANCYDGAPDAGRQQHGCALSRDAAMPSANTSFG